jgi:hypothetical protein
VDTDARSSGEFSKLPKSKEQIRAPALQPYIIEPIFEQFVALLPERNVDHPLGCHRPRIPDRVIFEKLVQVLVFGCAYWRIAEEGCSATTLRRRRDEWIEEGVMDALRGMVLKAYYDRFIGLLLGDLAVDGCITKAPCGGEKAGKSPVDRGKRGINKRSMVVDARVASRLGHHNRPGQSSRLAASGRHPRHRGSTRKPARSGQRASRSRLRLGRRPTEADGSQANPRDLREGQACPASGHEALGRRAHQFLAQRPQKAPLVHRGEARAGHIGFWVAFSEVVIIVRRLVREAWSHYRWETRPSRQP